MGDPIWGLFKIGLLPCWVSNRHTKKKHSRYIDRVENYDRGFYTGIFGNLQEMPSTLLL